MAHVIVVLTGKVLPSATVIVGENEPAVVGVPEMSPVAGFMERPVGRPVALHVRRSPLGSDACICVLTANPTTPTLLPGLVRTGCAGKDKAFTVMLQLSISWLFETPPVPAVKPNQACPPTCAGKSRESDITGLAGRWATLPCA